MTLHLSLKRTYEQDVDARIKIVHVGINRSRAPHWTRRRYYVVVSQFGHAIDVDAAAIVGATEVGCDWEDGGVGTALCISLRYGHAQGDWSVDNNCILRIALDLTARIM